MSPAPSTSEDLDRLKAGVAAANGFELYAQYNEAQAAGFLKIHPQTLKRLRLDGGIEYIRIGQRNISYLGIFLVEFLLGNVQWQNQTHPNSASENTGSPSDPESPDGIAPGMTENESIHAAQRLVRQALKMPSND
ncbi:MAG: hypothetical protein AAGA72_11040 [Pseudomonadota bacterium]